MSQSLAEYLVHYMDSIKDNSIKTKMKVGKVSEDRIGKLFMVNKITQLLVSENESCF